MASPATAVISAIGQVAGGAFQYAGNKAAGKAEKESAANALDFEKNRYQNIITALSPYVASGQTANQRAARLLGLPAGNPNGLQPFNSPITPAPQAPPMRALPPGAGSPNVSAI